MTSEVYQYWEQVDLLIGNDGLVFDTFPFELKGNLTCDDCPMEVIGLFSAYSEIVERDTVML